MMDNNSQKNKQIARNTLFLYFRMLFIMCISLYTSRVILEALGVSDYGIYNVVGGFVAMFALISSSLTSACTRFLNYEMGKGSASRLRTVFSTSLTVHIILACIIALLCESFGVWYVNNKMVIPEARLIAANWVFQISVLNFCINLVTVPFNAAIIAHEKMSTFAYVSIFEGISRLVICFLVMWISFDHLITYALLYMLVQVSVMAMYQVYCNRHFDECHYRFSIDKKLTKQMFSYSGWHVFGNSASILNRQGVDLVLNLFCGTILNAAKGISNQVMNAVASFANNFMIALNPQITKSYAKGDYDYMLSLLYRGSRFSYYLLFFLSLPIILNTDFIMHIWLKNVPEGHSAHENIDPALRPPSGFNTTYKRIRWDEPCSTISTNFSMISGCRNVHPSSTRSLTIREATRAQSFPDEFIFTGKWGDIRRAIGNAVPPILAACIAKALYQQFFDIKSF